MSLSLLSFGVVLSLALLSLVVFALFLNVGRDKDADAKRAQFLGPFGDLLLQWWFFFVVSPLTRLSLALGLTPNVLSAIALAFGAVAGVCFWLGWLELGAWALLLSGVWDMLDGRVARARGMATRYGAFIDTVLDRFIEFFMFAGFAFFLRTSALGAFAAAAALGGSLLVSYTRSAGVSAGVDCKVGFMQRGERLALICLTCLVDRSATAWLGLPLGTTVVWALLVVGLAGLGTSVYRTVWIAKRLAAPAEHKAGAKEA